MRPRRTSSAALACAMVAACAAHAQEAGEVLWRFEMPTALSSDQVAVGDDGTVYVKDNLRLYALTPEGEVAWTREGLGGGQSIDFLADGAIVTGLGETVWALEPDGSTRWTFSFDSEGLQEQIEVGPSVGPDGNIYAVTSTDGDVGLGAFSLTPEGDLRWSDMGSPLLDNINAGTSGPVQFTSEHVVFHFNISAEGGFVYGFDLDGEQTLYVDFTCTSVPRTDPMDRVILSGSCGIEAIAPEGEEVFWTTPLGGIHLLPEVGASGTIYAGTWFGPIVALDPDGSFVWESGTAVDAFNVLAAREDVGRVLYSGATSFGVPEFVAGVDAATGERLWDHLLMTIGGHNELVISPTSATSPDGTVAYFTTRFTSNGAPGAAYAIRLVEAGGCAADFNGDGELSVLDFIAFQNAFTSGDESADCDGNGSLNILDFVCFQNLFSAGCP